MPANDYHIPDITDEHHVNGHRVRYPASSPYELRSEEVQDIMNKMPHWIIRRGTTALFVVIFLLFTGAYFIHYPDVIITRVNISSSDPPVKVVARSNGKIQQIFVKNNEAVIKGESICLLENSAGYEDIIQLKSILLRLDTCLNLAQALRTNSFNHRVQLGDLQAGYAELNHSVNQYQFFVGRNFVTEKVGQLQSQIAYGSQLSKELQNRDVLLKQQLMLERNKFLADSSLLADKVIARLEFDNSKKELIGKQINAEATKSSILQNKLQHSEYLKTITDLQQQQLQQENDLQQKVRENVKRLQGQLDLWEQKYLMKSPVDGKAVFFNIWKENQYVADGETVSVIVPPVQNYVAKASLPVQGAGKVKAGQKVLISLSSYPFQEFGKIQGKVSTISDVSLDTAYSMEIILVNGLHTNTNRKVPFQAQLSGVAEVLTDDKNILKRLLEKIWIGNNR